MRLPIITIAKILDNHYVPYKVIGTRIIADTMVTDKALFEETIDLTDYSKQDLYNWLGY